QSCSCRNNSCGKLSTPSAVTLMRNERDIAMIAAAIARSSLQSMKLVMNERSIFRRSTAKWRQCLLGTGLILHHHRFGDFQFEHRRFDAGLLDDGGHQLRKILEYELLS